MADGNIIAHTVQRHLEVILLKPGAHIKRIIPMSRNLSKITEAANIGMSPDISHIFQNFFEIFAAGRNLITGFCCLPGITAAL